jgi:hypothetical protein
VTLKPELVYAARPIRLGRPSEPVMPREAALGASRAPNSPGREFVQCRDHLVGEPDPVALLVGTGRREDAQPRQLVNGRLR